jgi:hypothetical protein
LEEAPLKEYLRILREEGYERDADNIENQFLPLMKELGYTEEQIYETSFENVYKAVEVYTTELNRQIMVSLQPIGMSENMLKGEGADKLSPEQLQYIMSRQMQLHEEEKQRQGMN